MDAKEAALVHQLHQRVVARAFHERDILALLILLREHAPKTSPVRELADFVAHREKDRGSLKTYVHHAVRYGEALVNGTAASLKIEVVHTRDAFRKSLNDVLGHFRLAEFLVELSDDVLACVMSLLQDVRLSTISVKLVALNLGGSTRSYGSAPLSSCHRRTSPWCFPRSSSPTGIVRQVIPDSSVPSQRLSRRGAHAASSSFT